METVKRILTKEKIDRQLSDQSSKVSEGYIKFTSKMLYCLTFKNRSDEKIDNLTSMMSKLTAKVDKIDK